MKIMTEKERRETNRHCKNEKKKERLTDRDSEKKTRTHLTYFNERFHTAITAIDKFQVNSLMNDVGVFEIH